jgi:hypothetical protein
LIAPSLLIGAASLPPLYLFVMIQYGALTLPYWDHMATAKQIIQYFDGTLTWAGMIEPQNQARPLFPRIIFIANAALTKWDLRSEYVYIYLTIYGAFGALLFTWWRLFRATSHSLLLLGALLLSIIAFSPVGAMNQYWSLMLLGTLSYVCAIGALLVISTLPFSWKANISAAALAWISTYSISQGLFVFPTILVMQQLIAPNILRPTRWSLFWLANMCVCYGVYLPGVTVSGGPQPRPELFDFLTFVVVYIGNPLGSLLWFPEMAVVWLRETIIINFIVGVLLIGVSLFTAWRSWSDLRAARAETLIFYSCAIYTAACAIVTGWGRANGEFAIANANSSRYSIFAAFLLFGLIFYYGAEFGRAKLRFGRAWQVVIFAFVAASTISYVRAVPVYKSSHDDNDWLADVYGPRAELTDLDRRAYPDPDYFNPKRADLLRLGIGPYKSMPQTVKQIYSGPFVAAIPLIPKTVVVQRFESAFPSIRSISFPVVTWAKTPTAYTIHWAARGIKSNAALGVGQFESAKYVDWQMVTIELLDTTNEREIEIKFTVEARGDVLFPIGLPLFAAGENMSNPAIVDGEARSDSGKVGFRVRYIKWLEERSLHSETH